MTGNYLHVRGGEAWWDDNPKGADPPPVSPYGTISTFRGVRVDKMTREELIEALEIMGRLYNELLEKRKNEWTRTLSEGLE